MHVQQLEPHDTYRLSYPPACYSYFEIFPNNSFLIIISLGRPHVANKALNMVSLASVHVSAANRTIVPWSVITPIHQRELFRPLCKGALRICAFGALKQSFVATKG